jgi:hypothetical protein
VNASCWRVRKITERFSGTVLCFVSDRQESVRKLIGTGFENVRRKFDVWYAARSVGREVKIDEKASVNGMRVC